jgi:hypothetical protein
MDCTNKPMRLTTKNSSVGRCGCKKSELIRLYVQTRNIDG